MPKKKNEQQTREFEVNPKENKQEGAHAEASA